jgi:co-chaperonin GroES (HSP10)
MIKALNDKIIVQEMKRAKTQGGLIIPDSVQQPQSYGIVLSVGDKVTAPVEEGNVLIFHTSGGMAMVVEGKILRCLMEAEVYGIVESDEIISSLTLCEIKQADLDALDKELKKAQGQAAGGNQARIVRV